MSVPGGLLLPEGKSGVTAGPAAPDSASSEQRRCSLAAERRLTLSSVPGVQKERTDHARFLRQVYLPTVENPPEGLQDHSSFQDRLDQADAAKFNPHAPTQPGRGHQVLAPLRDDAALLDPLSGRLAPGRVVEMKQEAAGQRGGRLLTAPPSSRNLSSGEEEREMLMHQGGGKRWTSSAVSDAMLRARLGGWTSIEKVIPRRGSGPKNTIMQKISFDIDPELKDCPEAESEKLKNDVARKYLYTSETHRANADVAWDNKLPPKIIPPKLTVAFADPVAHLNKIDSQRTDLEFWKDLGALWDRFQTRHPHKATKPMTFMSPSPRVYQIPLYAGCYGGVNLEEVDNPYEKFTPFTIVRTPSLNSKTSYKGNIPGYTGMVHWLATEPTNSSRPSEYKTITSQEHGAWTWSPNYRYRHLGPFSRMVTTVAPYNPFNAKDMQEAIPPRKHAPLKYCDNSVDERCQSRVPYEKRDSQ